MSKIKIDFLAKEKEKEGQGVHSASFEDLQLLRDLGQESYEIHLNEKYETADIIHVCDVHPSFYFKMPEDKVTVAMVHFLPDTLNGSIKLPKPAFNSFKKYVLKFYSRAKELVTVNPTYVDRLVELGFAKERVTYIPNYVSAANFKPLAAPERLKARKKYGIPHNAFVVMACGQTQPRKGIHDFLAIANDNPEITFLWAGGFTFGAITSDYVAIKKALGNLPPNVHYLGIVPRAQMNQLYNAADVFFSPSYDELFPMTILEAANVNLPIVVRDLPLYQPILADKVIQGRTNLGFSRLLRRFHTDLSFRSAQSLQSAELAALYTKEKVYAQWDTFYRRIVAKYSQEK